MHAACRCTKTPCLRAARLGPRTCLKSAKQAGDIYSESSVRIPPCLSSCLMCFVGLLAAVHAQDNAYEFPYWYNWRSPTSPSTFAAFGGAITNFTVRRNPNSGALNMTWLPAASATQIVFNMTSPANISQTYRTDFYHPLSGTKEWVMGLVLSSLD